MHLGFHFRHGAALRPRREGSDRAVQAPLSRRYTLRDKSPGGQVSLVLCEPA